ncbi:class I SAM-dependent methyltransferase [Fluviispira sanaruensis]|uniref:SAM-dependent methyltransferase n=1 Tax=Fluviispira sanaruensis TaxID=2493639 RepID=A0A4P2W093_FLUSA|nr:class I SAM-dependent methyltransferase [Fluviispira sanaruensis]BBH54582.1 SAM-dependent methyltransferase [Fluviispira sanaruensis]
MEQLKIEKMRQFYDLFPYPNRPFFLSPKIEAHLTSHGGFARLISLGRISFAQRLWQMSLSYKKNNKTVNKQEIYMFKGEIEAVFPSSNRILLVGCGTDEPLLFRKLHKKNEILAVDLSRKALKNAKKKISYQRFKNLFTHQESLKKVNFLLGNAEMILKEKALGSFDFIQCFGVLHHQPNPYLLLKAIEERLNPGGALRLMVYSYHGRKLERRIQARYKAMWSSFFEKRFKIKILLNYLQLRVWQFLNYLGFLPATTERFRYLGIGSVSVADALMHPSDQGISLNYFHECALQLGLEMIYCEGKIENMGYQVGFENPIEVWYKILEADKKQELLTNPIMIYRKGIKIESK